MTNFTLKKLLDCKVQVLGYAHHTIIALHECHYQNGAICILAERLWGDEELEKTAISVNLPDNVGMLGEGEFFLKTWSEGQTTAEALLASGLVIDTGRRVQSGFVQVPIVKLKM